MCYPRFITLLIIGVLLFLALWLLFRLSAKLGLRSGKIITLLSLAVLLALAYNKIGPFILTAAVLGLILTGLSIEILSIFRRMRGHVRLLEQNDLDGFLAQVDNDIQKTRAALFKNKTYLNALLINKTAGLFFKGEFQQALDIFSGITPSEVRGLFRHLYWNNKLACTVMLQRVPEAEEIVKTQAESFRKVKHPQLKRSWEVNLASFAFAKGDYEKSKQILLSLIASKGIPNNIYGATTYYLLGLIEMHEQKINEGWDYLDKAEKLGKNTFVQGKIQKMRESFKGNA